MSYSPIEQSVIVRYHNSSNPNDYVEFSEVQLQDQSAYNPAVTGLAAFIWEHSRIEYAEQVAQGLIESDSRHFVATDPYGLHAGAIYGHATTKRMDKLILTHAITTADGSLVGPYQRTAAALLYCAVHDQVSLNRTLVVGVPHEADQPFYSTIGMELFPEERGAVAIGEADMVYEALREHHELNKVMQEMA